MNIMSKVVAAIIYKSSNGLNILIDFAFTFLIVILSSKILLLVYSVSVSLIFPNQQICMSFAITFVAKKEIIREEFIDEVIKVYVVVL